jgi:hypothetical protein
MSNRLDNPPPSLGSGGGWEKKVGMSNTVGQMSVSLGSKGWWEKVVG